jgi:hypothetical protein
MNLVPANSKFEHILRNLMGDAKYPENGYDIRVLDDRVSDLLKKEEALIKIKMFLKFVK